MVLPEGFTIPPVPHLVGLLVGLGAVGLTLARRRPSVTEGVVLSFAPWMVAGSALHVLYGLGALPQAVRPLAGTPSVYATVTVVAGGIWTLAAASDVDAALPIAVTGTLAALSLSGWTLFVGVEHGSFHPLWPGIGVVVSLLLGAVTWKLLLHLWPHVEATGGVGALAVASHALDGVSTAVGIDVLGFGERTPLSRLIIEVAAGLPTADVIGAGWLFVLVKLAVVSALVTWLSEYVREEPGEGRLLLGVVAAVGLGPGAHNILLFTVS